MPDLFDMRNAVNWPIRRFNFTNGDADRLYKLHLLLVIVRNLGGPDDDDIAKFTKNEWFALLQIWLHMQAKIDEHHIWAEQNKDRIERLG